MKAIKFAKTTLMALFVMIFIITAVTRVQASVQYKASGKSLNAQLLSVKDQLENAKKAGNAVFLVITGTGASGLSDLVKVANDAQKKLKKSTVIQMNRDDKENSELVTKFGVATIPVPFILVISGKGLAVGGYQAGQATADLLVKLVPSPKYDEVLAAINIKKPVFIVASKKTFTDKAKVVTACKTAVAKVPSSPIIVEVDMDDVAESAFLKQIGVNTSATSTVTVVVNASGNLTGNFSGVQTAQVLADAAVKVVKSGCCPAGSSSGCGPKK